MGFLDTLFGKTGEDKDARRAAEEAAAMYNDISSPIYGVPQYDQLKDLGTYDPSLVQASKVNAGLDTAYKGIDDTSMAGISADPRLKDSQYAALGALDDIIKGGGLTAQDKADLNRVQSEVAQADRGRRDAILQNAAARGMAGGGNELLAQLSSSQAATDRANQSGLDIAGMAQQRALDAIMQSGNMAGSMRSQDFGEQSDIAKARDAINQFNAANSLQNSQFNRGMNFDASNANANLAQQAAMANAAAKTEAARYGKTNAQDIANQNTGISNAAKDMRNTLAGQTFQDKMTLANAKSGAKLGQSAASQAAADRKVGAAGNIAGSIIGGVSSYLGGKK